MKTFLLFVGGQEIGALLLILSIFILLFLALRELVMWYWKINKIVANQEAQIALLNQMLKSLREQERSHAEKAATNAQH